MRQHRVIGLIGGMSWESTALYYRLINEAMHEALGGHHNARSALYTLDFAELYALASGDRWDEVADLLIAAAGAVRRAGADFLVLTANTAHAVADQVASAIDMPLLHIADTAAAAIKARGFGRVGLIGTRYTLEGGFYAARLGERHGIAVDLPGPEARETLQSIIIDELALGDIRQTSKAACLAIVERLAADGAEGVIVGCTELPLLIGQHDTEIPLFDTTRLHAEAAVRLSLTP
jgi:aspartate racemase